MKLAHKSVTQSENQYKFIEQNEAELRDEIGKTGALFPFILT